MNKHAIGNFHAAGTAAESLSSLEIALAIDAVTRVEVSALPGLTDIALAYWVLEGEAKPLETQVQGEGQPLPSNGEPLIVPFRHAAGGSVRKLTLYLLRHTSATGDVPVRVVARVMRADDEC